MKVKDISPADIKQDDAGQFIEHKGKRLPLTDKQAKSIKNSK